jgi:hypothetical protein
VSEPQWCNRSRDAYHIALNEDERSSGPWLSGLFAILYSPECDWGGMRVMDGAPAGRGTHPECSCKIELQDNLLVTSGDETGVSTGANTKRVKVTYIVKPLRACSRCMIGDRKRGSERRCGTPVD